MDISEKKYILAIDQGTTSSRAVIFDYSGQIKHIAQTPIAQVYPNPGWVEESPDEIWETQLRMCRACLKESGVSSLDIAAIGIANQRETTIAWDRLSGAPIYNAGALPRSDMINIERRLWLVVLCKSTLKRTLWLYAKVP